MLNEIGKEIKTQEIKEGTKIEAENETEIKVKPFVPKLEIENVDPNLKLKEDHIHIHKGDTPNPEVTMKKITNRLDSSKYGCLKTILKGESGIFPKEIHGVTISPCR